MANEKRRLIDANELGETYCDIDAKFNGEPWILDDILAFLDEAPTVDAEPVVHGRWITHNKGQNNWCECSECNTVGSPFWKRCPVCEAKMDGDGNG